MSGDECEGWHPSDQFDGVFSQTQGRTWTGSVDRGYKKHHIGTHGSQEHAAKARDMVLYRLEGPESKGFQVGLTEEEMWALDRLSLEQTLAELMCSKLDCRQRGLSKYYGVRPNGDERWQARFRHGEVDLIGTFFGEDRTARAYDGFALYAGGRGAVTNFDDYTLKGTQHTITLHVHAAEQLTDICGARTADAAANAAIAAGGIVVPAGKQHRRRAGRTKGGKQTPKAKATAVKDDPSPGVSVNELVLTAGLETEEDNKDVFAHLQDAGLKPAKRQNEATSTPAGAGAE